MIDKIKISKSNIHIIKWTTVIACSLLIGIGSSVLTLILKHLTENFESLLFHKVTNQPFLLLLFPFIGLVLIFYSRLYFFKNRKNKGISEVLEVIQDRKKKLASFKIPSHFFNGFLTVIFGGSTGIEVSTVVSTAAMGDLTSRKLNTLSKYKKEFIGAAIAAGVTILFTSPLAGLFFSYENILKKRSKIMLVTHIVSITLAWAIMQFMNETALFPMKLNSWRVQAVPFFLILTVLASLYGVFLTRSVIAIKKFFPLKNNPFIQVCIGALCIGLLAWVFPELYGDGYHAIGDIVRHKGEWDLINFSIIGLLLLLITKPVITAITLSAGGDGGVFAPSIFAGAILGLIVGLLVKNYVDPEIFIINFVIIGIAVTLSATLHAPFTSIFLACGMFNSYVLIIPLALVVFISKYFAKLIFPYTVYTANMKSS